MKRFKFQLQPVLRLREHLEDARKRKLAAAREREQAVRRDLDGINGEQAGALGQMRDAKTGQVDAARLRVLNRYLAGLQQTRHQHEAGLKRLETDVERKRQDLVAATRDRKVVDSIRARRLEQHRAEADREEQKTLDEASRARRRKRAG